MDDLHQSTFTTSLPEGWNESAGFRETFLQLFTLPGVAEAFLLLSTLLHDHALEARDWPVPRESTTRREVRAVAADLRHLQGVLVTIGRSRKLSSLSPVDEALADLAGRQAAEIARLAGLLERAVGPLE